LKNKIEDHPPQQFLGFVNKFILYGITFVSGVKLLSVIRSLIYKVTFSDPYVFRVVLLFLLINVGK